MANTRESEFRVDLVKCKGKLTQFIDLVKCKEEPTRALPKPDSHYFESYESNGKTYLESGDTSVSE